MSKTLKEKFLAGEKIIQSRISMASSRQEVEAITDAGCDLIYIDCQHGPYTECLTSKPTTTRSLNQLTIAVNSSKESWKVSTSVFSN